MYSDNKTKIQQMREALDQFEKQNEVGFKHYEEVQLMQQIEMGREAE